MKTRQFYQSNYVPLQLCLCIFFREGYVTNQKYRKRSEIDADIYVIGGSLIILIFQDYHFHQIHPTCKYKKFMSVLPGL